jgi:hypothetical protein
MKAAKAQKLGCRATGGKKYGIANNRCFKYYIWMPMFDSRQEHRPNEREWFPSVSVTHISYRRSVPCSSAMGGTLCLTTLSNGSNGSNRLIKYVIRRTQDIGFRGFSFHSGKRCTRLCVSHWSAQAETLRLTNCSTKESCHRRSAHFFSIYKRAQFVKGGHNSTLRLPFSGLWRRVVLVRTDGSSASEEPEWGSGNRRWFFARRFFYPEDGSDTILRNVVLRKNYTAPHPRRRHSS